MCGTPYSRTPNHGPEALDVYTQTRRDLLGKESIDTLVAAVVAERSRGRQHIHPQWSMASEAVVHPV